MTKATLIAAELLFSSHPLNKSFRKWVEDRAKKQGIEGEAHIDGQAGALQLTRRKARKFLTQYPQYRQNAA